MSHKPKLGLTTRKSITTGENPKVNAEQLELLHKHFPTIRAEVNKRNGSWGDVARGLSEKSGIKVNSEHTIWLHYNRKSKS